MNCCELVAFVNAVSLAICNCADEDQLDVLAAIFSQIGDEIATFVTCKSACNSNDKTTVV